MKHIIRMLTLLLCLLFFASNALAYPAGFLIYHGDREQKRIAITVDDIYDANVLRMMHDLSIELDFPITYFVLGKQIRDNDKDVWESIIQHGSEIGNHSWKHPDISQFDEFAARNQILLTQERMDELLGYHYPLRLFRPPFGRFTYEQLNIFHAHGVEKTVMWDVDTTNAHEAFKQTQNGSILLFHTNYTDYHCLVELIPMLQKAGYELVTISDLLGMEPLVTSEEQYIFPYR